MGTSQRLSHKHFTDNFLFFFCLLQKTASEREREKDLKRQTTNRTTEQRVKQKKKSTETATGTAASTVSPSQTIVQRRSITCRSFLLNGGKDAQTNDAEAID